MTDESKQAGWYPDPEHAAGERWWNGVDWSDSRRGGAPAAASSPYAPVATDNSVPVPPVPMPAARTPSPPIPPIYSAENPAPQRPDPYAPLYSPAPARAVTSINLSLNRNAMIGFVMGVVSLFLNLFFLLAPLAIVFSALGLVRARALAAEGTVGAQRTLLVYALIGLATGGISTLISLFGIVAFFIAMASPTYSS